MPRTDVSVNIPTSAKFAVIDGEAFVTISAAARLSKIHPIALEMAGELLKGIGARGCAFALETQELQDQASAIEKRLVKDLRKSVKKLDPHHKVKVKSRRDDARIVFWLMA